MWEILVRPTITMMLNVNKYFNSEDSIKAQDTLKTKRNLWLKL